MKRLSKRVKLELVLAVAMSVALSVLAVHVNTPRVSSEFGVSGIGRSGAREAALMMSEGVGAAQVQQVVTENIQGELLKGEFEAVVMALRNVTTTYGGRVPHLEMRYENELWRGVLVCKIPTGSVDFYTFEVRALISRHGRVTRIVESISEYEVSQTGQDGESLSDVSIGLNEVSDGGELPIIGQIAVVIPWLVTALVWIAQGLLIGLPLCFASLGIVVMIERGIVPIWKKQVTGKGVSKPSPQRSDSSSVGPTSE